MKFSPLVEPEVVTSRTYGLTSDENVVKMAFTLRWSDGMFVVGDTTLLWRHNGRDGVSNHQPHVCLLNHLFRRRSKKTSKLRVTGLCAGIPRWPVNSPHKWPVTPKYVSIWWRHHDDLLLVMSNIIPMHMLSTPSRDSRQRSLLKTFSETWPRLNIKKSFHA